MDTWHSILSRWIKPWTKVSLLLRIPLHVFYYGNQRPVKRPCWK